MFNRKTIKIGDQLWMAENLSVDDDGEGIYHHNGQTYYTWDAARRVADKIPGWHLPTKSEFKKLFDTLGGQSTAGKVLKLRTGWNLDGNGTDDFRFYASPVGFRGSEGFFDGYGYYAFFWSSTNYNNDFAYRTFLCYSKDNAYLNKDFKGYGFSVRLIKNKEAK